MNKSQKQLILEHMQSGKRINKFTAYQMFHCMTLAQRIADIKIDMRNRLIVGWEIKSASVKEHNNAEEYWMERDAVYQPELFN